MKPAAPLHTPICDLLGCRFPILQAGMGGVARSELAAAVSAAGGFGCLGMVREPPALIAREIAAVRERTDAPFGVNLIPAATDSALFDEELAVCIEARVGTMVFFWDVAPDAVAKAKAAGLRVLYQVGSLDDAQAAAAAGVDAVIAQGVEAGGHVKGGVSSLVLLPQVARALAIPVIGSGGFASGASLVAALALGAAGVHCGTAFLASEESFAHEIHKRRLLDARSDGTVHTDAFSINWPPDSPVRVLSNALTNTLGAQTFGHGGARVERRAVAEEEGRPIYLWSTDSPLRSMTGDLDQLALFAGQVAGEIDRIRPAGEIVADIAREASAVVTDIAGREEKRSAATKPARSSAPESIRLREPSR
ncbi:nitronate monooxygenase [Pikeienuella piscinae]|uniref:Nitronate monooxygenase n=1 Tax=Pikeienuella piscinae TaxID=2748098 RepID=A0A7L5BW65_9RHOB|nr:nitronate monooxygenase [Pikeienuella piscinae]QIE55088.1 nitronate monooxygenase [Pikeienuella piscinae]